MVDGISQTVYINHICNLVKNADTSQAVRCTCVSVFDNYFPYPKALQI